MTLLPDELPPPQRVFFGQGYFWWVLGGAMALSIQMVYRVPSQRLSLLFAWVSCAGLVLITLSWMSRWLFVTVESGRIFTSLRRLERGAQAGFVLLMVYSAVLWVNGAGNKAPLEDHAAQVVRVMGAELDLDGIIPLAWVQLTSWRRPSGTERILLRAAESRKLWAGQPVIVQVRRGRLGIPWVVKIERDQEAYARQILEKMPTAVEPWKTLINFLIDHQRWDEAAAKMREYLALYPEDYAFAEGIAAAFGQARRPADLVEILGPFAAKQANYNAYNMVGFALHQLGRREEAVQLLQASIPLEPENFWAYYHLGYVYQAMGQRVEAQAAFEEVLKRRPQFPEIEAALKSLRQ